MNEQWDFLDNEKERRRSWKRRECSKTNGKMTKY